MNALIGKVKSEFKNILSQKAEIVPSIDFSKVETIDFKPSHKLEEDEWFQIKDFSKQTFYIEQCDKNYSTASLSQVSNTEYKILGCLCIIQGNERHFQRITPALYVSKKTLLDYSGQPKIVEHKEQIEIRNESDAVYILSKDTLYFRNLAKIKSIFPGIEELHRVATQKEVDKFLAHKFIKLTDYETKTVGTQNRKRIADIGTKFEKLSSDKKDKLIKYAKDKSGLKIDKQAFEIGSDVDLKKLLYAIDQRYYYADIYEEERIASSIRPNLEAKKKK
jgi:hypothetical protein